MDEYIKKEDVLKLLNRNSITKKITLADGISIYDSVKNLPTNDVVPKSEVEKLKNELVIWKQNRFNLFQRLECYEMARQKVASEIFAEIEKVTYKDFMEKSQDFEFGYKIAIQEIIAELKKKYTE